LRLPRPKLRKPRRPRKEDLLTILTVIVFIFVWGAFTSLAFLGSGNVSTLSMIMSYIFFGVIAILGLDVAVLGKTGRRQLEVLWFATITLMAVLGSIAVMYEGLVFEGWLVGTGFFTALIALFVDGIRQKIRMIASALPQS
jgi:magnesium-transporting ATPase (P-type)